MTILATTAAPSHRDRSRPARARGLLVNLGLTLTMLVALAFLLLLVALARHLQAAQRKQATDCVSGPFSLQYFMVFEEVLKVHNSNMRVKRRLMVG